MVRHKKHWYEMFPIKEILAALTFCVGLYIHYQAGQNNMREFMYELKCEVKELKVRVNYLENGKSRPTAEHTISETTLATLPNEIKFKPINNGTE